MAQLIRLARINFCRKKVPDLKLSLSPTFKQDIHKFTHKTCANCPHRLIGLVHPIEVIYEYGFGHLITKKLAVVID